MNDFAAISANCLAPPARPIGQPLRSSPVFKRRGRTRYRSQLLCFQWFYERTGARHALNRLRTHVEARSAPGTTQFHQGIDKPARVGTPVKSALDGEVIFVGNSGNYGLLIKIQHAGNLESRYAHLSGANVSVGDTVRSGEVIGFSGQSGNATGPHLHFEIRSGGSPIDPTSYSSRVL